MQPFLGLFNLGVGEIVLLLTLVLILLGGKKLSELAKGMGDGIIEIRKLIKRISQAADDESTEAGRSLGGIYGKPAAEALTPDNDVAELYDPAVLENKSAPQKRSNSLLKLFEKLVARLRRFLRLKRSTS
jgi:sec-independent protein translocase protein TatA